MTSTYKFFLHAHLWIKINVTYIFWHNHRKPLVKAFLLVVLKYNRKKRKILFFIANKRFSVSLKLKLAVLGQNGKENNRVEHQNISALLGGRDGLKALNKTLLEVWAKIGEAKSNKELDFFNARVFDYDKNLQEPFKLVRVDPVDNRPSTD